MIRLQLVRSLMLIMILCIGAQLVLSGCDKENAPKTPRDSAAAANDSTGGGATASIIKEGEVVSDPTIRYTLQLNPDVGDAFSYRITQNTSTTIEGKKIVEDAVYNFTAKVGAVNDDGSLALEIRYDSIRTKRSYPPGVVDSAAVTLLYDTRTGKIDSTTPGALLAKTLIGKRVNVTISKSGEVREISNLEPILSAVLGKMRDSIPPQMQDNLREQIKVNGYLTVLQQLFLQSLPEDSAVTIGTKWTRSDSVPLMGIPSKSVVNYTFAEVRKVDDRPVGHVAMALTTTFPQKRIKTQYADATLDEASAAGKGDVHLDLDNGFPVLKSTRIDVKMKLTGATTVGPGKGKSQTSSQAIGTHVTVTMTNFAPAKSE